MNNNILKVTDVYKSYPNGQSSISVLKGINLEVSKGEILSIMGDSGAGKSTLLHLLGGLDKPDSGEILFNEQIAIEKGTEKQLDKFRSKSIGFIFQFHYLLPEFTSLENVLIPALITRKESRKKAIELLEEVGLANRMGHKPNNLSGGEQQRVAIVRALINEPDLILADEPIGNLDFQTGNEVYSLLARLTKENGKTLIMATHSKELAMKTDRVVKIMDGKIT